MICEVLSAWCLRTRKAERNERSETNEQIEKGRKKAKQIGEDAWVVKGTRVIIRCVCDKFALIWCQMDFRCVKKSNSAFQTSFVFEPYLDGTEIQ